MSIPMDTSTATAFHVDSSSCALAGRAPTLFSLRGASSTVTSASFMAADVLGVGVRATGAPRKERQDAIGSQLAIVQNILRRAPCRRARLIKRASK
eukprot:scaffold30788_cov63-Phaeocystis_antarctica.AAC.3